MNEVPQDAESRVRMPESDLVTVLQREGAGRDASAATGELQRRSILAIRELNVSQFDSG